MSSDVAPHVLSRRLAVDLLMMMIAVAMRNQSKNLSTIIVFVTLCAIVSLMISGCPVDQIVITIP